MLRGDLDEATALLAIAGSMLAASAPQASGEPAATLRRAVAALAGQAEAMVVSGDAAPLLAALNAARLAGATIDSLDRLRIRMASLQPSGAAAQRVATMVARHVLVQEARLSRAQTFQSRDEALALQARLGTAFDAAEEAAADAMDTAAHRALLALHAAVTRDLVTRGRPLPTVVTYTRPTSLPAVVLAQQLYGDASRAAALVAENRVRHPLFMPTTGRALSA